MTYIDRVQRIIGFAFPERQMLVRSHGNVKAIVWSPIRQMCVAFALLAVSFWFVYATTKVLNPRPIVVVTAEERERDLRRLNEQLANSQARQRAIEAQLEERTRLLDAASRRQEAAHIAIRRLIEESGLNDIRAQQIIDRDKELDDGEEPIWRRWRF